MGAIVTIANHKGGVGKTTLVVNLADAFNRSGLRVLVVDMDAQANSTKTILGPDHYPPKVTLIDAIFHQGDDISQYIREQTCIKGVHLIAGSIKLMRIEEKLRNTTLAPSRILIKKLNFLRAAYDIILIDTPPNLSDMPAIALTCSDYYFVPLQSGDTYSMDGMDDLTDLVKRALEMNPELKFGGAILNRHDGRNRVNKGVLIHAISLFENKLLTNRIPDSTKIKTAAVESTSVISRYRSSTAATMFIALAHEMASIMGVSMTSIDTPKAD